MILKSAIQLIFKNPGKADGIRVCTTKKLFKTRNSEYISRR
jgi:hypothetical protein